MNKISRSSSDTKMLYLMTLLIIYLTDSLLFGTNSNPLFLYGKRFAVILIAVFMLLLRIIRTKTFRVPAALVLLSISIYTSSVQAGRYLNGYSYYTMIATLWFGFLFSEKYSSEEFAEAFCVIMRLIAIVSVVCWMLADIIDSLSVLPTITNTTGIQYKFLGLTNIPLKSNLARRNMGPFWEPGAFQVYLIVALYFTLFLRTHRRKWVDAALFCGTALTTLSGAPLIPMVMLIAAYSLDARSLKGLGMALLFCLFLLILFSTGMFDEILEKLSVEGEHDSMSYRMIAIEGGIKGFLANPLFGSTPEINEAIKSQLAAERLGTDYASNANTFINYFAYYGVFVGVFMAGGAYRLFRKYSGSALVAFVIFLAYFISTSNENMMASLMVSVISLIGYKKE